MRWLLPLILSVAAFGQGLTIGPNVTIGPKVTVSPGTAAGATVAFDNVNTGVVNAGTAISFNLTIGSGSNRAIGIGCSFNAKVTAIAVTVGGTNAPAISGTNSTAAAGTAYMVAGFGLANPSSGSQAIAVGWTGSATAVCGAISVTGANQTTPLNNGTFAFSTSGVPTVSVTSNAGDLSMAFLSLESGSAATGSTQTEKWNIRQNFVIGTAGSIGPGTAGPITHAWATTGSEWELAGMNFHHA